MKEYIYLYGTNVAQTTLENTPDLVKTIYIANKTHVLQQLPILHKYQQKLKVVDSHALRQLVNTDKHQNIVLAVSNFPYWNLENLLLSVNNKQYPLLLILDQITDPHNFGAILRSVDMLGADGIIILAKRQVPLNSTVAKVSSGAFNYVPVCQVPNLTYALERLKKAGFWIYATSFESSSQPIGQVDFHNPVCLIVGSEGKGVSPKLLSHSDYKIYLPTVGHLDSLNVSVASAILIYHIRQSQG